MSDLVEIVVGRIGRPHGLRGDVFIDVRTDEPGRRFVAGAKLLMGDGRRSVELEDVRWHRGRLVVRLAGFPDRTAIEGFTGELLRTRVPADERPSEPEEYFDRQLIGLTVLDAAGNDVGRVTDVLHMPAQDVLQLDVAGEERLVPFVQALVARVDLDAAHVQLADVAGLLEDIE